MDIRLGLAVLGGKLVTRASRSLGIGGGTTFPGTVARKIDAGTVRKLAAALPQGTIVVTGTNGKTTTTRLISTVLQAHGLNVVHNRAGANLLAGVSSALVGRATLSGKSQADIGLFEVDEAVIPSLLQQIEPRVLVLTNLFRDQLDRYGEVDYLAGIWHKSLQRLSERAIVLLNADDPQIAALGKGLRARVAHFSLDDPALSSGPLGHAADTRNCLACGAPLLYKAVYYGHVGDYHCQQCDFARPAAAYTVHQVAMDGAKGSSFTLTTPAGKLTVKSPLPGVYNIYNVLAALSCAGLLGLPAAVSLQAVATFAAAFGRVERVAAEGRELFLALVKNPVGFGEVLRTIVTGDEQRQLLIAINDKLADGTDVSWLWDVDFEVLQDRVQEIIVTGLRAEDMAVRLKYAGLPVERIRLIKDIDAALTAGINSVAPGGTLYVTPTYTAMLEMRQLMHKRGYVTHFWED